MRRTRRTQEKVELFVTATDACGNVSAPCVEGSECRFAEPADCGREKRVKSASLVDTGAAPEARLTAATDEQWRVRPLTRSP